MKISPFHKVRHLFSHRSFNRRHFLRLTATGGTFLLTGCQRFANLFAPDETNSAEGSIGTPTAEAESSLFSFFAEESLPLNVLRVALGNQPGQWDPAAFFTIPAYQYGFALFDGLVWVDQNLVPQPALATEWSASPDGLSWTFTLRQGVEFHHGLAFTAKDVVYTFERLLDPKLSSPLQSVLGFIDSIEEVKDGTETGGVRFMLNVPNGDLSLLCGAPQARIVPHDYSASMFAAAPSGTGPFRFVELTPNEQLVFRKNANYWNQDAIQLEEVHHIYIESVADQIEALEAGVVDLILDMSAQDAASLIDHDTVNVLQGIGGAYQTVVMQATEEPFTDVRVRKALKMCLDRSVIQAKVLNGQGEIASDHPVAPFSPFVAELPEPTPDVEGARQLLIEAGYPNGLKLDLITSTVAPGMVELAEAVQELSAPAGFEITPTPVPADVYWGTYWLNVPFHIGTWNFRPSIDETLSIAYHSEASWNEGAWKNPEFDGLIEAARSETDDARRKSLYADAQQLLAEDGAVVIPYFRPIFTAAHKRVIGFEQHPAGWLGMMGITAEET